MRISRIPAWLGASVWGREEVLAGEVVVGEDVGWEQIDGGPHLL